MAVYAQVNRYGFIESPCRKVKDGKVTDDIDYISPIEKEIIISLRHQPRLGKIYY